MWLHNTQQTTEAEVGRFVHNDLKSEFCHIETFFSWPVMALTDCNELTAKLSTLKRTPCPKPPVAIEKESEFFSFKLKSTKPVETNGGNANGQSSDNNNEKKTRSPSIRDLASKFDKENGSPGNKPIIPGKKPVVQNKPPLRTKPTIQTKPGRPPSLIINKPSGNIPVGYEDTRVPELIPIPPPCSIGDPPEKPPKFWSLKKSLEKYLGTSHPPRPVIPETGSWCSPKPVKNEPKPAMQLPTDGPSIPKRPAKPEVTSMNESEEEPVIDGVVNPTEDLSANDSMDQDFYGDTASSNDLVDQGTNDETFGEELYEPLTEIQEENYELLPAENDSFMRSAENESLPPTLPPHIDKKAKEESKEGKKKKEKEEKEKRRKEKEEKEKEEKERKKRDKDKEKKLIDMKRRFSVRGTESAIDTCIAAVDIQGNKMDLPASIGEVFDVIRKDKPNPNKKWLVRNKKGQFGFIDISKIQNDDNGEELYEEVGTVKMSMQSLDDEDIPAPPTMSPPPPPQQNTTTSPQTENQEIYDDVAAGGDGEELYECLPE